MDAADLVVGQNYVLINKGSEITIAFLANSGAQTRVQFAMPEVLLRFLSIQKAWQTKYFQFSVINGVNRGKTVEFDEATLKKRIKPFK